MKIDLNTTDNLMVRHGKDIEKVLQRAVRKALMEHKRAGNPVASWQDGKVALIAPEDIPEYDDDGNEIA